MFEDFHQRAKLYDKNQESKQTKFVIGERNLVYMAKYSTPQVIYKMLVKTVMKYHFISSK